MVSGKVVDNEIVSGNVYRIKKNVNSQKYADVLNGRDANLTNVQQYDLNSGLLIY